MSFWSSISGGVGIGIGMQSDEVQRLAKDFAYRYSTSETNQKTLQYIASFIGIVKSKYPNVQYQSLFRFYSLCL